MVDYSNYSYEPSLSRKVTASHPHVDDFPVMESIADKIGDMTNDVEWYRTMRCRPGREAGCIHERSFLEGYRSVPKKSVDLLVSRPT